MEEPTYAQAKENLHLLSAALPTIGPAGAFIIIFASGLASLASMTAPAVMAVAAG